MKGELLMDGKKAQSCLKTFLEVSKIVIDERNREIRGLERQKAVSESGRKSILNERISVIVREREKVQGRLDSVRLEMLDMILDDPSLISPRTIAKKGCDSVASFVKKEKESIELRGSYRENPYSISDVLSIALANEKEKMSFSLFDEGQKEVTKDDIKSAVNSEKVVKTMIKTL